MEVFRRYTGGTAHQFRLNPDIGTVANASFGDSAPPPQECYMATSAPHTLGRRGGRPISAGGAQQEGRARLLRQRVRPRRRLRKILRRSSPRFLARTPQNRTCPIAGALMSVSN